VVFGLFGKKQQPLTVVAPMTGQVKPISETPDPVFAQKMMGDGFCMFPTVTDRAKVVSPVAGEVVNLFPTGHAVGIRTADGLEVLVHIGIDTVKLQGKGFRILTTQGARVTAGQTLMEVDLAAIKDEVPSLATPVVFTNLEVKQTWRVERQGQVSAGDPVGKVQ